MSELTREKQKEIAQKLGFDLKEDEEVSEELLKEFLHENYSDEDRV